MRDNGTATVTGRNHEVPADTYFDENMWNARLSRSNSESGWSGRRTSINSVAAVGAIGSSSSPNG